MIRPGEIQRPSIRPIGQETTTFVGLFSPRSDVKQGQHIRVAVDTRSLHIFDPESALAIYRGGSTP